MHRALKTVLKKLNDFVSNIYFRIINKTSWSWYNVNNTTTNKQILLMKNMDSKALNFTQNLSNVIVCICAFAGLSDPEGLERHVQHPWHARDSRSVSEPRALRPKPVLRRSKRVQNRPLQLRPIWRWCEEVHRPGASFDCAQNSCGGVTCHGRLHSGNRNISKDADGANRASGQWIACVFQLQNPRSWEKSEGVHAYIDKKLHLDTVPHRTPMHRCQTAFGNHMQFPL